MQIRMNPKLIRMKKLTSRLVSAGHWVETFGDLLQFNLVTFSMAHNNRLNQAIDISRAWREGVDRSLLRVKVFSEL